VLRLRTHDYTNRVKIYRADSGICNDCLVKSKCTTSETGRDIKRNFDEEYVERVRAYQNTAAYKKAIAKRKVWVEPLFAEGKDWHGMERFRLRLLEKVNIEALPGDIPDSITHDVSGMQINDTLTLSAVTAPAGITLLDDLEETVIATITPPTLEPVEEEIETEVALVGEEGEAAEGEESAGESAESAGEADSGDES